MEKPKKYIKEYYDYFDCCYYIAEKYECDTSKFLCDVGLVNGTFHYLSKDELDDIDDENEKFVYSKFIEEFGDDSGELEVEVYW